MVGASKIVFGIARTFHDQVAVKLNAVEPAIANALLGDWRVQPRGQYFYDSSSSRIISGSVA
jgi:hypothetical protein